MNKEIQILHTIFQLELNPPFELIKPIISFGVLELKLSNKHSEHIGYFHEKYRLVSFSGEKDNSILRKVKQVFNMNKLSNDDVYRIAKHLLNWLQDKFPDGVKTVRIHNMDTTAHVYYPIKVLIRD